MERGLNAHLWCFFSYEVEDPIRLVLYRKSAFLNVTPTCERMKVQYATK